MDPAPTPISSPQYRGISFDLIGTLLDFESGIYPHLTPLTHSLPASHPFRGPFPVPEDSSVGLPPQHPLLAAFGMHEGRVQAVDPTMPFEKVLRASYHGVAGDLGVEAREADADAVVASIASWPGFPDTAAAMARLRAAGYKLFGLTNNSRVGARSLLEGALAGVQFDAVWTAEEIGSYKPARENFDFMLEKVFEGWGIGKEALLHVAHGVGSDHVPAEEMGIRHVWVERGSNNWGETGQGSKDGMKLMDTVEDMETLVKRLVTT